MKEVIFEVHKISRGWICFSPFGTVFAISQPVMMAALIRIASANGVGPRVRQVKNDDEPNEPRGPQPAGGPELSPA